MEGLTYRSESASESVFLPAMGGAGRIGDTTGTTAPCSITTTGTTRGAIRFTTGAISTEEEACGAESVAALTQAIDPGTSAGAVEFTTVPAQRIGLSTETTGLREDTLNPAVRAEPTRAPSAVTTMADRQGAFRHGEALASVAEGRVEEEELAVAAAAGIDNRSFVVFPVDRQI